MPLSPGDTLGAYRIVAKLGEGGMGEVYRAHDTRLGRDVALKVLPDSVAGDANRLARFEREARSLAALSHPNIVTIHSVESAGDRRFLTMELVEGKPIDPHAFPGGWPIDQFLNAAIPLAEGVAFAHERGITHRDLKPANILLRADGRPTIVDFGLAVRDPGQDRADAETESALTRPGSTVGTPRYMSPEQAKGLPTDSRSDIFSLGAILYELLSGGPAFAGANANEVIAAILRDTPAPLARVRPDVPERLARAIGRCLEKDPRGRFQSALDLRHEFDDLRAERTARAAAATPAAAPRLSETASGSSPADLSAIAVLPFADMSPARDQDYLCEGLAEELIHALTRVGGLRVVGRTASFHAGGAGAGIAEVGRRLGVGTLLEGSVRKAGDRLRVTVQLIEVATGYHRWSERFDRKLDDVFAIQEEIAEHVATSLRGSVLSAREKDALLQPQTGAEAYESYLRGRQHLPRLTKADLDESRIMFERAIALDPTYSPAWASLAMVHATLYEWFGASDDDLKQAERTSHRALELSPDLAEAHVARGCAQSLWRRYDEAGREFDAAIRINPNLFDVYYYYARMCFASGDIARSADLFRKAADSRLEDFQSLMLLGQSLRMLGRREEAREATREGIRRAERILELNPTDARALSHLAINLYEDGQTARAYAVSERSLALHPDDMGTLIGGACLHAKAGHTEQTLALLERVFARGWGKRDWIDHDPDYDIIRDDPRFQALLAKLK